MAFKLQQEVVVQLPSDTELIAFVEQCGVQVWPCRASALKSDKVTRTPGDIVEWWAQLPWPRFLQIRGTTWRNAVARLMEAHKRRAEDTPA